MKGDTIQDCLYIFFIQTLQSVEQRVARRHSTKRGLELVLGWATEGQGCSEGGGVFSLKKRLAIAAAIAAAAAAVGIVAP